MWFNFILGSNAVYSNEENAKKLKRPLTKSFSRVSLYGALTRARKLKVMKSEVNINES